MTTITLTRTAHLGRPDDRSVPQASEQITRRGRSRWPRIALWGTLEAMSIVLQFAGFMVVLLAQGVSTLGNRALGNDDR